MGWPRHKACKPSKSGDCAVFALPRGQQVVIAQYSHGGRGACGIDREYHRHRVAIRARTAARSSRLRGPPAEIVIVRRFVDAASIETSKQSAGRRAPARSGHSTTVTAGLIEQVLPVERIQVNRAGQAIEIDMLQTQPARLVDRDEHIGRRRHARHDAKPLRDALGDDGLARPQIAAQRDEVPRPSKSANRRPNGPRGFGAVRHDLGCPGRLRRQRTLRASVRA